MSKIPSQYGSTNSGKSDVSGFRINEFLTENPPAVAIPVGDGRALKQPLPPDRFQVHSTKQLNDQHPTDKVLNPCVDKGFTIDPKKVQVAFTKSHQQGLKSTSVGPHSDFVAPDSSFVKDIKNTPETKEQNFDNNKVNDEARRWKKGYATIPTQKQKGIRITQQRDPFTLIVDNQELGAKDDQGLASSGYPFLETRDL